MSDREKATVDTRRKKGADEKFLFVAREGEGSVWMAFREGGRKRPPSDDRIQHGKDQSLHLKGVKSIVKYNTPAGGD